MGVPGRAVVPVLLEGFLTWGPYTVWPLTRRGRSSRSTSESIRCQLWDTSVHTHGLLEAQRPVGEQQPEVTGAHAGAGSGASRSQRSAGPTWAPAGHLLPSSHPLAAASPSPAAAAGCLQNSLEMKRNL